MDGDDVLGHGRIGRAFCSAHFRDVPVLLRDGSDPPPVDPDDPPNPDLTADGVEAVTCLDYGVRCTGWLCPLFTVPTVPPEDLLAEAMEAERRRWRGAPRRRARRTPPFPHTF